MLGTTCSLVTAESSAHLTPGPADASRDSERLRLVDERTERMENALNGVLAKGYGSGGSEGVVELENDLRETPQRDGGIGSMVLRAFRQGMSARWVDPVKLGLVSEKQLDQCLQQWVTPRLAGRRCWRDAWSSTLTGS